MVWGALRVWNNDSISTSSGFPPHPHTDLEFITYVRDGAITSGAAVSGVGTLRVTATEDAEIILVDVA